MPQSFTSLHYHVVFSTRHRAALISPDVRDRLYAYVGGIIRKRDGVLLAAGGMPDHVHLLLRLHAGVSVADAVRFVKSNSSKWIHETFGIMADFAWQDGYAAFTVSQSNIDSVRNYILRQAEHHRVRSYDEEISEFFARHGISTPTAQPIASQRNSPEGDRR